MIKPIAFYLPQFHPIPENDLWWGKGFTEWTNVTKAKPLFPGHYQPFLPADLGYYDLRISEIRVEQSILAKSFGIYGFAYWHYWFGGGKMLLQRPAEEMLSSGQPDFPFCFAWANETWSGRWHGLNDKVLITQDYPGVDDVYNHFMYCLPFFRDHRYIKVNGKPVFIIYRPNDVPDNLMFLDLWQKFSINSGFEGVHFIGVSDKSDINGKGYGGRIQNAPIVSGRLKGKRIRHDQSLMSIKKILSTYFTNPKPGYPETYSYSDYVQSRLDIGFGDDEYPLVLPGWDNTPRSSSRGLVLHDVNVDSFKKYLEFACRCSRDSKLPGDFLFVKSWNEWAEGNVLEPSIRFGNAFLEGFLEVLSVFGHFSRRN
jgi:lipopolysaccharide biosynthesis protein